MTITPSRVDFACAFLRNSLRSGSRAPGSAICVKDTAAELRVSPTPVREALERLVGEGLVTPTGAKGGFQVVRLSVTGLSQLIDLHGVLADAAHTHVHKMRLPRSALSLAKDPAAIIEGAFGILFWERVNAQLGTSAARVTALLAPYRRREPEILPQWQNDIDDLINAFSKSRSAASIAIRAYHRRRMARAADLISTFDDGA